ncbi:MAG: esterase/lipase family protein [Chitinispirillaceae bacterium]
MKYCLLLVFMMFPAVCARTQSQEAVILLHGLGRSSSSMEKMEKHMKDSGYLVVNVDYQSTKTSIDDVADSLVFPRVDSLEAKVKKIHFVTHSMGGIIVRHLFANHEIESAGRVVMMGPPNRGSEVADFLTKIKADAVLGDNLKKLRTDSASLVNLLPAPDCEFGVIAGTRSINLINSIIIKGRDDGKVSVENTRLEGMKDHVVVPVTHTFMMRNGKVIEQTLHFLKRGCFKVE